MRRRVAVRLRRGGSGPDTGPVIGAAFGVILASAQAGDETAFARIFRDVQPPLLRYLRVIAPEAEDVAGDTWLPPGAVRVAAHRGLRRLAQQAERAGVTR